jgi:hypothetical protein
MSCEERDLTFDQNNAFIAFRDTSGSMSEKSREVHDIELYYASRTTAAISVTVETDTTGIEKPAVEGLDFNIVSSRTFSFESELVHMLEIESIDNDLKEGNKSVNINLIGDNGTPVGMAGGKNAAYMLTIMDDEHPLARWIGTYDVYADSYGDVLNGEPDGAWDETWEVTTSAVAYDDNKLSIVGIGGGSLPVIATIDLDSMTITLPGGADVGGDGYGFDEALIWRGDYDNVEEADVVGFIQNDGSIAIDLLTMIVTDDTGIYIWDSFNTSWTKTGKKSAHAVSPKIDKLNR